MPQAWHKGRPGHKKPQWRYLYLTGVFILLILVRPFFHVMAIARLFTVAMVASVWIAGPKRLIPRAIMGFLTGLAEVWIVFSVFVPGMQTVPLHGWLAVSRAVLSAFFLFFCGAQLLASLLRTEHVMTDDMVGAINFYMILGFAWAQFYTLLEIALPQSFQLPLEYGSVPMETYYETAASKFLYFSFVTQATEGYGDIVPLSTAAETLVILQTTVGQLYLALVVAYLLSVHVTQRLSGK